MCFKFKIFCIFRNKFKLLSRLYKMAEQVDYTGQLLGDVNSKVRDLEEKQRVLRDRLLLIGQNLIEIKEKSNQKMMEIKKDIETMKSTIERLSSFLDSVSSEFSKFAKKDDLEILTKQAKMFQPMEFVRKEDLENLKR
jgi:predicted  nucleic acid-binding Zn-ribbon protein